MTTDETAAPSPRPFAWLLKPSLLDRPYGDLAHLLEHRQVGVLSESLRVAYEKIFEDPSMEGRKSKFRAEANRKAECAIDRIYELTALAVLRLRQWQLLEHEPTRRKGKRTPDHLMLALEGIEVVVEVNTLHLAEKVDKYEPRKRALAAVIQHALRTHGIEAEINVLCSYRQLPRSPRDFAPLMPLLGAAMRESLGRRRLHTSFKLPGGGEILVNLKGDIRELFEKTAPEKLKELDRAWRKSSRDLGELRMKLEKGGDLQTILGQRIFAALQKKDRQIVDSGLDRPGVVAMCMGHHDTSIREAVTGYRLAVRKNGGPQKLTAVKAMLVISAFDVEITRQIASVSKHPLTKIMAQPVVEAARRLPVAAVEACWVPLASDFPVVPIGKVWDILGILGPGETEPGHEQKHFILPIFPKMVEQKTLEPVPPPSP